MAELATDRLNGLWLEPAMTVRAGGRGLRDGGVLAARRTNHEPDE